MPEEINDNKINSQEESNSNCAKFIPESNSCGKRPLDSGEAKINLQYIYPLDQAKIKPSIEKDEAPSDEPQRKKQKKGKNVNRPKLIKENNENKLCRAFWCLSTSDTENECKFENCKFSHNIAKYLESKPGDISSYCHNFNELGSCPYGNTCRYMSGHTNSHNICKDGNKASANNVNKLSKEVQFQLRKRKYDFTKSINILKETNNLIQSNKKSKNNDVCTETAENSGKECYESGNSKNKIDWNNKLYLAPLTTVGNLPFRRVCKKYGADVTCSEMAVASCLLQGSASEWALLKRHSSEDFFGIQLCASNAEVMAKCCQLLEEQIQMDFVDINMGCPIDLIYRQGGGSALMRRVEAVEKMVRSMNKILSVPVTLKMRTGIYNSTNVAHEIIGKAKLWDVSLLTVHGRSREQRYVKKPNWDYIYECAKVADPIPLFGNGDILTYDDYVMRKKSNVSGVMIGRGALIKPWIFTEIKEQRNWDISSTERYDILKDYVNAGLEHWGSDTEGVEKTRRFLLEWLSFLYRYIPVGVLDKVQTMNQRPPAYFGRNDLETLMASPNVNDWIKISEMLLGKVPESFQFLPKHKANSWT